jgi:choline-glycine betaine transporter
VFYTSTALILLLTGAAGHAVDGFGMFVTLLGLVTNLGIGSLQVSSGLENLFGMEHSNTNLLIVIIVMSTVATIAAVSGVENGIRRRSNLNIVLFSGLLIPLGFTLAWLSIFGNSALDLVMNQGAVELGKTALEPPSMAIYQLLEHYPASKVVIGVSIFVGFVLFLTPADSGAVMMANLSCKGGNVGEDAPHWLRIFWSAVITLVTIGLLFAGNFEAMQTMVVLAGLPFSVVLVFFMFGLQGVRIEREEGNPFVYEVSLDGYLAAASDTVSAESADEPRARYYRAEVYLHDGSQDYDLMGFTQDQITRDVLDQFESHRQLLGRVYS